MIERLFEKVFLFKGERLFERLIKGGGVISRENIYSRDGAYSSERTYLFERESARLFNGERLSYLTKEACLQIGDYSTDGVYLIVGAYSRASLYSNKVRC